jgi:hypothetical protein
VPVVDSGERREVQLREAQEAVGQDYGVLWCCLGGLAFRAVRIRLERDAERERERCITIVLADGGVVVLDLLPYVTDAGISCAVVVRRP